MSAAGGRFESEFTADDLDIVNLGYWDPGADSEPNVNAGAESNHPDAPTPATDTVPEAKAPITDTDAANGSKASPARLASNTGPARTKKTARAVAAGEEDEFSRVERIPGGVKAAIEAILAVADRPVSVREFSAALIISERSVETVLDTLRREYNGETTGYGSGTPATEPRGFELRRVGGGWRLYSRADFSPWVARFVTGSHTATLSKSAYETLAVIAYRQPVTRAKITAIRGVNADNALRQLVHRQLVRQAGKEPGTGAQMYETTELLLTKLGLNSLEELPPLAPLLPDDTEAALLEEP